MHRSSVRRHAEVATTSELWGLLEQNLSELAHQAQYRHVPPERRARTVFCLEAVRELRRRGQAVVMLDPSAGRASRNAILGWEE